MNIKHVNGRYLMVGWRVQVDHAGSFYHGDKGTIISQGRWGYFIVRIVKDGERRTPEIARGHLVPVRDETIDAERQ